MNLFSVSINHRTAPVELRESLHLSKDEVSYLISKYKEGLLGEGLIISTCNRTEIYGVPSENNFSHSDIQKLLVEFKNDKISGARNFQNFFARDSVNHLFSVACGIDSLLIGDNQIFKQVKDSFQIAEEQKFTGTLMKKLFDSALRVGKRAITETAISEGAVTISFAAVQLIEKIFSSLSKKTAIVIGAGETGELAARHLVDRNIGKLLITNRTFEKAEKLADELRGKPIRFEDFKQHLHLCDIIISATSSDNFILTRSDINSAMKKRNYTSLVIADVAIPRDIDPDCKKIDYVFYHDIDSLNIIVDQNLAKRKNEIPKVQKIIEEETENFFNWFNSLQAAPTIKDLHDYFEAVRAEEVEKNINKFSEADKEKFEIITKRIINKLLHHPTIALRKAAGEEQNTNQVVEKINLIRELFGIDHTTNKIDKEENK